MFTFDMKAEHINASSAQIEIYDDAAGRCRLYLYTHIDGANIISIVREVLSLNKRWDDPDYFARMLFCRMTRDQKPDADMDYGIGTKLYADTNILLSLDFEKQRVHLSSSLLKSTHYDLSFSEFCDAYESGAQL